MKRMRKFKVGDLVIHKRKGIEVTVVGAWYDRNAVAPSQLVVPIIEIEEHLHEQREYVLPKEIEFPTPGEPIS